MKKSTAKIINMSRIFNCVIVALGILLLTHCTSASSTDNAPNTSLEIPMKDSTINKLTPCPKKPNCACSEFSNDKKHYVEPFDLLLSPSEAIKKLIAAIEKTGGTVVKQTEDYIHATYTSKLIKFVDDVEFRIDTKDVKVHVRSASRVGYSDLGVNKKRVAALRKAYNQ